ncbi:MAG: hypothetical protein PVI30_23310 [Myxococcales bacterium]|jgi:hypothetical protein
MGEVKKPKISEPMAAVVLLVVAVGCASLLMVLPRHVPPLSTPLLTLDADAVAEALRRDAELAHAAKPSGRARELDALLLEHGRLEVSGPEEARLYRERRRRLREGYAALVQAEGQRAALALRAVATERFDAALDLELPTDQARAAIGATAATLAHEGATVDGVLVAPRFVARVMFEARWNVLHGRPADADLSPVKRRALFGWQALQAEPMSLARRLQALERYAQAGGAHVQEAMGVLLFRAHEPAAAAEALAAAQAQHGSIRLRNYALGARLAAGLPE